MNLRLDRSHVDDGVAATGCVARGVVQPPGFLAEALARSLGSDAKLLTGRLRRRERPLPVEQFRFVLRYLRVGPRQTFFAVGDQVLALRLELGSDLPPGDVRVSPADHVVLVARDGLVALIAVALNDDLRAGELAKETFSSFNSFRARFGGGCVDVVPLLLQAPCGLAEGDVFRLAGCLCEWRTDLVGDAERTTPGVAHDGADKRVTKSLLASARGSLPKHVRFNGAVLGKQPANGFADKLRTDRRHSGGQRDAEARSKRIAWS